MKCPLCKSDSVFLISNDGEVPYFECKFKDYSSTPNHGYGSKSALDVYVFGDIRVFVRHVFEGENREFTQFQLFNPEEDSTHAYHERKDLEFVRGEALSLTEIIGRVKRFRKTMCFR